MSQYTLVANSLREELGQEKRNDQRYPKIGCAFPTPTSTFKCQLDEIVNKK